jgi:hypothetical protein
MKMFIAEDGVNSTKLFDSRTSAYDAFLEKHDMEPLRILDVTQRKRKRSCCLAQ